MRYNIVTWYSHDCHTQNLVSGADSWSVSELVHAVAIMAHVHALAGFALGCGINPEIDTDFGHTDGLKNGPMDIIHCTNPALGWGGRITSDSDVTDSGPISPVARSPTHPSVLQSRVHHFIECEWSTCWFPLNLLVYLLQSFTFAWMICSLAYMYSEMCWPHWLFHIL